MLFSGVYNIRSDKQGRLVLPRTFRRGGLAGGGVLYARPGDAYWICALEDYFLETLNAVAPGNGADEMVRDIRRSWMAAVQVISVDPQGRFSLASLVESPAGEGFVVSGTGRDFEIWRESVWEERFPKDGGKNGTK